MSHELPATRTWERASKFREHLSAISIPPINFPPQSSRFSPDSPPLPHIPLPDTKNMSSNDSTQSFRKLEAGNKLQKSNQEGVFSRLRRVFFNLRVGRQQDMGIPMQEPWQPLRVQKRIYCEYHDKTKERNKKWKIILIIVLLYLLINSIVLNVKVLSTPSTSTPGEVTTTEPTGNSSAPSPKPSSSTTLSNDAQQCLSQFTLNAPSNPSGYPCSSCLPVLAAVPSNFSQTNPQDGQNILNAVQFCGLKSLFDSANSDGQAILGNGSWVQDVKFCAWTGVSCDGSGQVSSISLTFPGVPASIPSALGNLVGLQSFTAVGNGQVPGGSLPGSFLNLTGLLTLHLESTGMTALPDGLFNSLKSMKSLTLVKNGQFGGGLPSTITSSSLQTLVINGQALSTSLTSLLSSSSLQSSLHLLDLSSTGLSTSIPSSISSFKSLVELHLDSNNLQPPVPSFPASLQILSLSNNTALSGSLPGSLCSSTTLQSCTLTGTGLSAGGSCGVCKF